MNKTEYFLDTNIIETQNDNRQNNNHTFAVKPNEVTPSFMFKPTHKNGLSVALRFSNSKSQWSENIFFNSIDETEGNEDYTIITSKTALY